MADIAVRSRAFAFALCRSPFVEEESAGYRGRGSRFDDRRFRGPIRRSLVGGYGGFGGFGGIGGFGIGSVGYALGGVYALPVASVVPVVTTAVVAPVAPVLLG